MTDIKKGDCVLLFNLSSDFTTYHKSDIIINDTVVMQYFQQIVQLEERRPHDRI